MGDSWGNYVQHLTSISDTQQQAFQIQALLDYQRYQAR